MGSHQHWNGYWQPFPPQAEYPDYDYRQPYAYNHPAYHPEYSQSPQYSPHPQQQYYSPAPPSQSPHPPEQPRHAYPDPRIPAHSPFTPTQMFPGAFDYQVPEVSGLSLDDRPGSPQYVGRRTRSRARSRASSKASNTTRPTSRVDDTRRGTVRGRKKAIAPPPSPPLPGYRSPYVETAPNSPFLLPCLSSDGSTTLEENEDYKVQLKEQILREAKLQDEKMRRVEAARAAREEAARQEAERLAREEAARIAREEEAARAEAARAREEAARIAREEEAARLAREEAARVVREEAARVAREEEAARVAREEAARVAREEEAARAEAARAEAARAAREEAARTARAAEEYRQQQQQRPKPFQRKRVPEPLFSSPEPDHVSLERDRTPYASSSATTSTAASSPPPTERMEKVPLERERRQYSTTADSGRDSRRHSYVERAPSPPIELERQRRQYGGRPGHSEYEHGPEHYSDDQMPPETAPRQPQPYAVPPASARQTQYSVPPETMPRQSQPYSLHPETPPPTARQPQPYASHAEPPPPRQSQPYSSRTETPPPQSHQSQPYSQHTEPPPLRHRKSYGYSMRSDIPPLAEVPPTLRHRKSQGFSLRSETPPTDIPPPSLRRRKSQGHSLRSETPPTRPQPYQGTPDGASRQSQFYAMAPEQRQSQVFSMPPETTPRQSQPYASSSTSTIPRRAQQSPYSVSAADLTYSREDLRMPQSAQVPPSPRQPQSPRFPDPHHYTQSPLNTRPPQNPPTSRFDHTPATSNEPSPKTPAQETFGSLVHQRPTTPQSEYLGLIPACPKKRPVSRGRWYGVPEISNFHVCEKCYELHIYDTAFVKFFVDVKLVAGQKTHCAFNTPRVLNFVWPKTVEENHFDIFKGYAIERSQIGSCTSIEFGAKTGVWYTIHGNPRGGFIACQACYQDVILASPFHQFFGPLEATVSGNTISCHVAWPFIEARLLSSPSTWEETQDDIEYRLHMVPGCPGNKMVVDSGRRWWKPKGVSLPLFICDCCYWDGIFPTVFATEFTAETQGPREQRCCAMSGYQLSTVWQYAAEQEDIKPWLMAADSALSPMCTSNGSVGKVWNVFKDPELDGFDFCERCTEVFIRPLGFGSRLEKRRYASTEIIKCDLNPAHEYQGTLLQKLGEAAAWRDFSILKQYLVRIAPDVYHPSAPPNQPYTTASPQQQQAYAMPPPQAYNPPPPQVYRPPPPPPPPCPPCPGDEIAVRNHWYCADAFFVCEECYRERVKPSPFGNHVKEFDLGGEAAEGRCDLGAPEWRAIWQKRCLSRDFSSFLEAVKLKKSLDEIRFRRQEANEEMEKKARRGLFPDEKRRMMLRLNELREEERDTTNMLAALTRI